MNVVKILLGLGAGYFILQALTNQSEATRTDVTTDPTNTNTNTDTAPKKSADDWNWFRKQSTGVDQPAPEEFGFTGNDRFRLVTEAEYNAMRAAHGLAGLGDLFRLAITPRPPQRYRRA